jgi:DNA-binding CsgD family transcriptional regulator
MLVSSTILQAHKPQRRPIADVAVPASAQDDMFGNALDLLSDGIAVLRRDSTIVYASTALHHLAAHNSDFRIDRNAIKFRTPILRSRFAFALGTVTRGERCQVARRATDFAVSREDDMPPYTVSVRRLLRSSEQSYPEAIALLLMHDPLQQNLAAGRMLQELYDLTDAQAQLVQALGNGMTAVAYAKMRRVSVATVYTHLRRTREKTGWKSVAELTRRFHELNVSLRAN